MTAILGMPQYVAYQKNVAYAFIKLSAKSYSFNILCTMSVLIPSYLSEIVRGPTLPPQVFQQEAELVVCAASGSSFHMHNKIATRPHFYSYDQCLESECVRTHNGENLIDSARARFFMWVFVVLLIKKNKN